jgi:nucleoside-diphosphate-sugar epimerase
MPQLFCFGLGYSARVLASALLGEGWRVTGTSRRAEGVARLEAQGFAGIAFDGSAASPRVASALQQATHVLVSAPPDEHGDPVLRRHRDDLAGAHGVSWIGYLSTVGVYGDHGGAWVEETSRLNPVSERSRRRVAAEEAWLSFGRETGRPVMLFRLAGIYGPGRNALEDVLAGEARRIIKEGQVFNRIHVEDIAAVLRASIARPRAGAIYNVTDDEPAPPQDVVAYAADLLSAPLPPALAFATAELSPMARSFYGETKRVSNRLIREELGVRLSYPTYREAARAMLAQMQKAV